MSVLSFVALELQTTHLDPASVSQASYVKLVNGNITLVDSWPVIPPTASGDAVNEAAQQTKTWAEAVSQLTMMVGALPVVSYYRDADKEVFQAASQQVGKTPPEFHWLDCRELAKKYLPDLPEFQLSTVLQALGLFDEYGNSNSVEQTSQIVMELARRHDVGSVKELWGELYDQPDKLLGLDAGLEGLNFAAVPAPVNEQPTEDVIDEPATDANIAVGEPSNPVESVDPEPEPEPEPDEPDELIEPIEEFPEELAEEPSLNASPEVEFEDETTAVPAHGAEVSLSTTDGQVADPAEDLQDDDAPDETEQDIAPALTPASEPILPIPEPDEVETPVPADDSVTADTAALDEELDEDPLPETSTGDGDALAQDPITETPHDGLETPADEQSGSSESDDEVVSANPAPTEYRTEMPTFEVVEVAERHEPESQKPKKSSAIRTLGFVGVFGFGLLTVVGVVLTVMATMLFFTENLLLLETKIAGVILTGAITVLSLLMTVMSFKSFRDN